MCIIENATCYYFFTIAMAFTCLQLSAFTFVDLIKCMHSVSKCAHVYSSYQRLHNLIKSMHVFVGVSIIIALQLAISLRECACQLAVSLRNLIKNMHVVFL